MHLIVAKETLTFPENVCPSVLYLVVRITSATDYNWAIFNIKLFLVNPLSKYKLEYSGYLALCLYLHFWWFVLQIWEFFSKGFPSQSLELCATNQYPLRDRETEASNVFIVWEWSYHKAYWLPFFFFFRMCLSSFGLL